MNKMNEKFENLHYLIMTTENLGNVGDILVKIEEILRDLEYEIRKQSSPAEPNSRAGKGAGNE